MSHPPNSRSEPSARRLDIQGLRAVAVLMVVTFHAGLPVPGGFVGVDVFFVISGFVIAGMLRREWLRSGRIRFGHFYLRRFKRLTPALALMTGTVVVLSAVVLSPLGTQQTAAKTAIGAILIVANFVVARTTGGYFDAPAATNPLLNTWSLSVEEQFYLVFPALIALGWMVASWRTKLRLAPHIIVALVAAASFGLAVLGSSGFYFPGSSIIIGFYSPFTRAWEFAVGALLALVLERVRSMRPSVGLGSAVLGAVALAASLWMISGSTPFPGLWTLLPVVGTALLLYAGAVSSNPISQLLAARPMTALGDWSYSIYLWHWPFIVFAGLLWPSNAAVLLLAALASMIPSLASYYWVEQPIRNLSTPTRPRVVALIAATLIPALALSVALLGAAQRGWWSETVQRFQGDVMALHVADDRPECVRGVPIGDDLGVACTWNATGKGSPIYLVGDSTAEQFTEGAVLAGETLDRPVVSTTMSNCPFLIWPEASESSPDWATERCREYVAGMLSGLARSEPGTVLISMSDKPWFNLSPNELGPDGAASSDSKSTKQTVTGVLSEEVSSLQAAGQRVVLIQPTPKWHGEYPFNPALCTGRAVMAEACRQEMPREWAYAEQSFLRSVVAEVAAQTGSNVWDPWDELCSTDTCSTTGGDFVRYGDETHISVPQSEALAATLVNQVNAP